MPLSPGNGGRCDAMKGARKPGLVPVVYLMPVVGRRARPVESTMRTAGEAALATVRDGETPCPSPQKTIVHHFLKLGHGIDAEKSAMRVDLAFQPVQRGRFIPAAVQQDDGWHADFEDVEQRKGVFLID